MTPRLSVVVVSWNGRALLGPCLESVRDAEGPPRETIVVDNGSTDGTREWLALRHPEVRTVFLRRNRGFAVGCNAGIAASSGEWVLTLNNDAALAPGALATLWEAALAAPPEVGALQPLLRFPDGRLQSTGVTVFDDGCAEDRDFGAPADAVPAEGEILCATAGAALYRRAMLDRLRTPGGPFDPTFYMYFEDVDLGWRARLAGWTARFVPGATVTHAWQGTSRRLGRRFVKRLCKRNRVRALAKNASGALLASTLRRTATDLRWLWRDDRGRGVLDWLGALATGLRARGAVTRSLRLRRRDLERAWVRPLPAGR